MKLFGIEIRKAGRKNLAPMSAYNTGERIWNHNTAMSVGELLANSSVNACVNIISDAVACLPLYLYRDTPKGRVKETDSTLYWCLKRKTDAETMAYTFKKQIMMHLLLKGNAFIFVGRRGSEVTQLTALDPERVTIKRDDQGILYYVYECDGMTYKYTSDDVLHIPACRYNGVRGMSPLDYCTRSARLGNDLDDYTADYFANGVHSKLIINIPADESKWTREDSQKLSERIVDSYGGVNNSHKPFILAKGMTAQPLNLAANTDSQLVENRTYTTKEIAKIFRVPLSMLGESDAKYNNNEQQSQNFLQNTLTPWLVLIQEYLWNLIPTYDRQDCYIEFDTNTMLRADSQTRTAVYREQLTNGMLTLNDINRMENKELLPEDVGDVRFMPVNLMPLTKENIDAYMATQKANLQSQQSKVDESDDSVVEPKDDDSGDKNESDESDSSDKNQK